MLPFIFVLCFISSSLSAQTNFKVPQVPLVSGYDYGYEEQISNPISNGADGSSKQGTSVSIYSQEQGQGTLHTEYNPTLISNSGYNSQQILNGGRSNQPLGNDDNIVPNPGLDNSHQLETTNLNSPILAPFAKYFFQAVNDLGVYPELYDVSFSPETVAETFRNEMIYFAVEMGLYDGIADLAQQAGKSAEMALQSHPTPFKFFKVLSNTLQLSLAEEGILTDCDYQVLSKICAQALHDATRTVDDYSAESAFHATIVGAAKFFKSVGVILPKDIKYVISTVSQQLMQASSSNI